MRWCTAAPKPKHATCWQLHRRTGLSFAELAKMINPVVAGWMQYYGRFYRSALYRLLERINAYPMRWIRNQHKRLRRPARRAAACAGSPLGARACSRTGNGSPTAGDQDDRSRVTGDCYARICGSPG